MGSSRFSRQESVEFPENLGCYQLGCRTRYLCLPGSPVEALDLVSQHHPGNLDIVWKCDLKWIPFGPVCYWTHESQTNPLVVFQRGHNQGWAPTRLLVPGLRVEGNPH